MAGRTHFAGRILLVPSLDDRRLTAASNNLKLLAELTDHSLQTTPYGARQSERTIADFIKTASSIENDGVIFDPRIGADPRFLQVLATLRRHRPRLAIDTEQSIFNDSEADLSIRLTRMICRRLGESIRILPFYTESGGASIRLQVSRMIAAVGGIEVAAGDRLNAPPDLLLFVVLPGTTPTGHQRLIDGIRLTIGSNTRVAIADLTNDRESRARLFAALRHERWVDRLAALAGSDTSTGRSDDNTTARAISQAVLFLAGYRSLRDDEDRLYRIDRSRVRLLFARCLEDYVYPLNVRPLILTQIQEGVAIADIENEATARLLPQANALFNEQFRRNIHATRLVNGGRTSFEISILQQLRLRFSSGAVNNSRLEILPSIHLATLSWPWRQNRDQSRWEVKNDDLDVRLRDWWHQIPWESFAVGSEKVEVTFRDEPRGVAGSLEGYHIRSRKSRSMRRIEIFAATDQSRSYAISQLARLGASGSLAQDLEVSESPRFVERGVVEDRGGEWSLQERVDLISLLGRLRMNRYVLVVPPTETTISAESVALLQDAAKRAFVNLTVVQSPPAGVAALAPFSALPCLAPVKDLPSITPPPGTGAAGSVLLHLAGPPYTSWLRLASAAELLWDPEHYRRDLSAHYLLVGEDADTIQKFRQVFPDLADCQPGLKLPPSALAASPRNGRRVLSLLRGELQQLMQ